MSSILLALALQALPVPPQPVLAAGRLELGLTGSPKGLAIGRLDDADDDDADLFVVTESPGQLAMFRGLSPGLAPLPEPRLVDIEPYSLGPLITASHELLIATRTTHELIWFQDSPGGLTPSRRIALDAKPRALALGESSWTTGGGERLALATADLQLLVFQSQELEATATLQDPLPTALCFVSGGLVVASQGSRSLDFFRTLDEGAGLSIRFSKSVPLGGIPRDLAVLDLDGDGDEELVALFGDRSVACLGMGGTLGLGPWLEGGSAAPEPLIWRAGAMPVDLAVVQLDGSGAKELIATHLLDQIVSVMGDFDETGPRDVNPLYAGAGPWNSTAGDLDGDGFSDLVTTNPEAGAVSVFFGSERHAGDPLGGFRGAPFTPATQAPHSMATGDFDADGREDVALLSGLVDRVGWLRGSGAGLVAPDRSAEASVPPESDELERINLDGRPGDELLMLHQSAAGTRLFGLRLGQGGWIGLGSKEVVAEEGAALLGLELGPGRPAALVSDQGGRALVLVELGLDATSKALTTRVLSTTPLERVPGPLAAIRGPGGQLRGVAVGMADGEGASVGLLAYHPPGASTKPPLELAGELALDRIPKDLVGCDLNGDGAVDLAILSQGVTDNQPGRISLWLGPGPGAPSWRPLTPLTVGPKPFHLAARDLNGDGADELFATSQYAYRVDAFSGTPGSGRPKKSWRLGTQRGAMDLAFLDVDGDGVLELAVSNNHSSDVSLLRFK